jgi:hypothetical protein
MPDHRFMYPKVVPLAPPAAEPVLHNFDPEKLRNWLQPSGVVASRPKTATGL